MNINNTNRNCCCLGDGNVYPDGPCDAGYYCPGGQDTASPGGLLCLKGHFCVQGSVLPELCPNGTYQYDEGRDACDICPAGYYCNPSLGELFTPFFRNQVWAIKEKIFGKISFMKEKHFRFVTYNFS